MVLDRGIVSGSVRWMAARRKRCPPATDNKMNNDLMMTEDASVQPSPPLIDILHRKLRDPSLVSSFERQRARDVTEGVVGRRWILKHASTSDTGDAATPVDDDKCSSSCADEAISSTAPTNNESAAISNSRKYQNGGNVASTTIANINSNSNTKYNTIPKRKYIDLRMEQNRMFADNQCIRCQRIFSKLPASTAILDSNGQQQWKEHADSIQSLLDEGLAACPNHAGLLRVEGGVQGLD